MPMPGNVKGIAFISKSWAHINNTELHTLVDSNTFSRGARQAINHDYPPESLSGLFTSHESLNSHIKIRQQKANLIASQGVSY